MRHRPRGPITVVALAVAVVLLPLIWTAARGAAGVGWAIGESSTVLNAALWTVGGSVGTVVLASALTFLLAPLPRRGWITGLFLVPAASSTVVVAVVWRAAFAFRPSGRDQVGLVNEVLTVVGLPPVAWLAQEPLLNTIVLVAALVWIATGPAVAVLLAVLDRSTEGSPAREARDLGAMLRTLRTPIVLVGVVVAVVAVRTFDLVWVATGGAFGTAVPTTEAVDRALQDGQVARGAAMAGLAVILAALGALAVWAVIGRTRDPFAPAAPRRGRHRRRRAPDASPRVAGPLRGVAAAVVAAVALLPLAGVVVDAVRTPSAVAQGGWWNWVGSPEVVLGSLRAVLHPDRGDMWTALIHSVVVVVPAVVLAVLTGLAVARTLAAVGEGGRRVAWGAVLLWAALPPVAVVLPLADALATAPDLARLVVVWIVHAGLGAPLVALLVARRPSPVAHLVGAAALQLVVVWGDLLVSASLLGGDDATIRPVTLQLATLVAERGEELHLVAAGALVVAAVPVVVVLSTWRCTVAAIVGSPAAAVDRDQTAVNE